MTSFAEGPTGDFDKDVAYFEYYYYAEKSFDSVIEDTSIEGMTTAYALLGAVERCAVDTNAPFHIPPEELSAAAALVSTWHADVPEAEKAAARASAEAAARAEGSIRWDDLRVMDNCMWVASRANELLHGTVSPHK